ncbi:hypothetical protein [Melaminivora sp.]
MPDLIPIEALQRVEVVMQIRLGRPRSVEKLFHATHSRNLSDLEIVGCKSAAAAHFSPSFCPIARLLGGKSGKNWSRWG